MTSLLHKSLSLKQFTHAYLDWVMVDRLTRSGTVRREGFELGCFRDSALAGVEGHDSIQPHPKGTLSVHSWRVPKGIRSRRQDSTSQRSGGCFHQIAPEIAAPAAEGGAA